MERISEELLKQLQRQLLGKRIRVTGDNGELAGLCSFFGYNPHIPSWGLQATVGNCPVQHVRLSSIKLINDEQNSNG